MCIRDRGYGAPVPMDLYDIVLPILYHDSIRDEILKYDSLASCLIAVSYTHLGKVIDEWISTEQSHLVKGLIYNQVYTPVSYTHLE